MHIGGWRDSGRFYLDVSFPVRGFCNALRAGYSNHQESIYHVGTNRSFRLKKRYRTAA